MSNGGPRKSSEDGQTSLSDALDCTTPNVARMYDYYLGGCFP